MRRRMFLGGVAVAVISLAAAVGCGAARSSAPQAREPLDRELAGIRLGQDAEKLVAELSAKDTTAEAAAQLRSLGRQSPFPQSEAVFTIPTPPQGFKAVRVIAKNAKVFSIQATRDETFFKTRRWWEFVRGFVGRHGLPNGSEFSRPQNGEIGTSSRFFGRFMYERLDWIDESTSLNLQLKVGIDPASASDRLAVDVTQVISDRKAKKSGIK